MNEFVAMPNEMIEDLNSWLANKDVKSVMHLEFAYSYYWYITYLWRYAKHLEEEVNQGSIKELLGYNPNEKRIDYIIKRNGLLDVKGYTTSTGDFPIGWGIIGNKITFDMFSAMSNDNQSHILQTLNTHRLFKKPLLHINHDDSFVFPQKTHMVSKKVFDTCMEDEKLKAAGFFLYGILTKLKESSETFTFSNDLLCEMTGWAIRRVIDYKTRLSEVGLLHSFLMDGSSKGEKRIYNFLTKKKIIHIPEYSFSDLKGVGNNSLRFDFAIFNDNHDLVLLIEYDGEHHFRSVDYTGIAEDGGKLYLEQTRLHDIAKNRYCKKNGIPLLRIPHWEYDNIEEVILDKLNELAKPPCLIEMLTYKSCKNKVI